MRSATPWLLCATVLSGACGGGDDGPAGTAARTDYTRADGFYSAPFPSESRRTTEGTIDVSGFPNPPRARFIETLLTLSGELEGFGTTSPIYFAFDGELAPVEVSYADSLEEDAPVFLVSVDAAAADHLGRYPVEVAYHEDGGPFGDDHLLSVLPLQGAPLRPGTLYATVVRTTLLDVDGEPIVPSPETRALLEGRAPEGMGEEAFAQYRLATEQLEAAGVDLESVAAMAVFRTQLPTATFARAVEATLAEPLPGLEAAPTQTEVFGDYCVYEGALEMPIYQQGEPPFDDEGGGWVVGDDGAPVKQGTERARIVITIPRAAAPASGFPAVVFSRTGGGGDRPLVDRGVRPEAGGEPAEPGSGPAREFARVGWAGVSIDGPHGGLRNVTGRDEQLLIFNVNNPLAMRDNIRQSALELVLAAHIVPELTLDTSDCAGAPAETTFDPDTLALMGHSMGATIAPLALAYEPRFRAALLSGAGGSWIQNIVHKESPVVVRPVAEAILGVAPRWQLHEHDPSLMLLQWAGESADPPAYGRLVVDEPIGDPRHVLMMQGIVDTYILPPIANATSLSFGLDLAGPAHDEDIADRFAPLSARLPLVGAEHIDLPASGNVDGAVTAVVTQHPEDGIEDGHEVVFQTEPPKRQYRCFLESLAAGDTPVVPDAATDCP